MDYRNLIDQKVDCEMGVVQTGTCICKHPLYSLFSMLGRGGAKFCVCMQINMFMVVAYYRYDNIYFLSQNWNM